MGHPSTAQRILGFGAAVYARTLATTMRWQEFLDAQSEAVLTAGPAILCFWHEHVLMLARPLRNAHRPAALVSRSRDGEIAALAVSQFDILPIRASRAKPGKSNKGGLEGFVQMAAHLQSGGVLALAPDGPRGPARQCSPGIVQLARFSGAPLVCLGVAASAQARASSWDRTSLPLPGARGALVWGPPISIERGADQASLRAATQALEGTLNALDARARAALLPSRWRFSH